MTIWQLVTDGDYNGAYLIDEKSMQCSDRGLDYLELQNVPFTRELMIEEKKKGFSDIMYYGGILGAYVVSHKAKEVIETHFGNLAIQFFPCHCKQFPNFEMWILNVCEYHDLFDINNSIFRTLKNHKDEEKIVSVDKIALKKEAFDFDLFKIYINGYKSNLRLFVSDRFKAIMEENGVTGLALEKVCSV